MYGVRLHPAKDREGTKLSLSVAHTGVLVFQVKLLITESIFIRNLIASLKGTKISSLSTLSMIT